MHGSIRSTCHGLAFVTQLFNCVGCKRNRWFVESFNMSSIQQVATATVCLVAAFAFGSYINQSQIDQSAQPVDSTSPDSLRSLFDTEPELVVQKVPSSTPWMKPKLSARIPMPILPNSTPSAQSNFGFSQQATAGGDFSGGKIPPPSDLRGRVKPTQQSLASSFSIGSQSTGLVTDAPSFDANPSGESSMPVVNQQSPSSSPNLADSMRAPFQAGGFDAPKIMVEDAPVFAAPQVTAQTSPMGQSIPQSNQSLVAPVVRQAPSFPNLNQRSQPFVAAKPTLLDRPTTPLPSFRTNRETAQQPTVIREPAESFETTTRDQFRFSNSQRTPNNRSDNNLMPIPRLNQTVTINDPGAAFGNRDSQDREPQAAWANSSKSVMDNSDYYPEQAQRQQPQNRVMRLPLQLNSTAQSKLTRLRDNTIQKISLRTTQFSEHVVERGDSLQSIASRYFGKPDYYLDIYLANRDRLRFPGDLREGMSIKIPIYEQ